MSLENEDLERFFDEQWIWLQKTIQSWVEMESPSSDFKKCDALAGLIETELVKSGAQIVSTQASPRAVLARYSEDTPKTALVFHHDTVWPVGSFGPTRMEDGRWYGPGIFDMKANLALVLLSLKYLAKKQRACLSGLLWASSPDEETLGPVSTHRLPPFLKECSKALVFEPPLPGGLLKHRRKGCARLKVQFFGKATHTGNHYASGKSALAAAARFLLFAEGLSSLEKGHTINIGILTGGSAVNTRPGSAEMLIDARMLDPADWEQSKQEILRYRDDDGVELKIEETAYLPPMHADHDTWNLVAQCCRESGCTFGLGTAGGGSDGSRLAAMGIDVMDGLGIPGAGEHAENEHIQLASLKPIFMRNTRLIYQLGQ